MCAIAGIYGFSDQELIVQFSRDLAHRGPDGEGVFHDSVVSLLNRRLAIIDRAGGDQPIYNEDNSVVVVYNGEIYNYRELRNELQSFGHVFQTESDTEVLVHGYETWGEDVFDRLNGMFAIALYDNPRKKLLLVRDHFGIKPLYFAEVEFSKGQSHQGRKGLLFASELTPILNSGRVPRVVNERTLYRYLRYRVHDDGRDTFFSGISRLLPGEMMILTPDSRETRKFSSFERSLLKNRKAEGSMKDHDTINRFHDLLHDAVSRRLISERPVGTALSGGIDSSSVVAIVRELLSAADANAASVGAEQNTFSAVFPGSINNEERYIDAFLSRHTKILSHKIHPTPRAFFQDLHEFIRTQEEPTISSGPYAQFKVMQKAKEHVTVLLDGQGADEMMAGYLPYIFVYLRQLLRQKRIITLAREVFAARDILLRFGSLKMQQIISRSHRIDPHTVLRQGFVERFSAETFRPVPDDLKRRLHEDIFKYSLPALLRYEDRNTMHFSLEGRVPFLDVRLVKMLFTLPDRYIIRDGWNKFILRRAMKGTLPDKIRLRRSKIGFTTPEEEWLHLLKKEIYEIFLSQSFATRPYWNAERVLKLFRLFLQDKNDDTMMFWRLLNTELWLREFIDPQTPSLDNTDSSVHTQNMTKTQMGNPNEGKSLEIKTKYGSYRRYPIRTDVFKKGDNYPEKIATHVLEAGKHLLKNKNRWYVVVSEKIVAISQGRSYFIWDINPTWYATLLSKFVRRTPHGIGLGSPWTMQIAITEVGLPRMLLAALVSAITKPLGVRGMFYRVAGPQAAGIDGPTEYSLYPSNVSAKLAPKDPQDAAKKIREHIQLRITNDQFGGAVIIDANDLGRNVLGNATDQPDSFFEAVMKDNPMGQGSEQTPVVIVTRE